MLGGGGSGGERPVTTVAVTATAGPEIAARDKHRGRQAGRCRIELSTIVHRNRGK